MYDRMAIRTILFGCGLPFISLQIGLRKRKNNYFAD